MALTAQKSPLNSISQGHGANSTKCTILSTKAVELTAQTQDSIIQGHGDNSTGTRFYQQTPWSLQHRYTILFVNVTGTTAQIHESIGRGHEDYSTDTCTILSAEAKELTAQNTRFYQPRPWPNEQLKTQDSLIQGPRILENKTHDSQRQV